MKTKQFYILLILLISNFLLSSCRKAVHYRFTDEEANFLPYKLGDSIAAIYDSKTEILFVASYDEDEGGGYGFAKEYYETLEVDIYPKTGGLIAQWRQYKKGDVFKVQLGIAYQFAGGNFRYTHSPSELIVRHENIKINNENYKDVIELIDTITNARIFLNSLEGIILLETENNNYYFELL